MSRKIAFFRKSAFIVLVVGLALIAACRSAEPGDTPPTPQLTLPPVAVDGNLPTATPESDNPPTPTAAASPTVAATAAIPATEVVTTAEPGCVIGADYVADVTIPDDTALQAGTRFVKTWRVRNSGTCAWEAGSAWVFVDGEQMGGPEAVSVPVVEVGESADISVSLIAPAAPGTYTGYWALRRPSGVVVAPQMYVRIQVTDTPVAPLPGAPVVNTFRADTAVADPGDTVTLTWDVSDATQITIYQLWRTGQLGDPHWDVAASGAMSVTISADERNSISFALFAANDTARDGAQATVYITLNCPHNWFFSPAPEICAQAAVLQSAAAEQRFEHGTMLWVEAFDQIYVLYDDGVQPAYEIFGDEWSEGQPESDPSLTPPEGLSQPIRGFGLVWRTSERVRERLGWALGPESGFFTRLQTTSYAKYNSTYLLGLDGTIWVLGPERSSWEKIAPQ